MNAGPKILLLARGIVVCFGWLAVLLPLLGCSQDPGAAAEDASAPPAVEAVPARVGALPLVERLSGTVKARNQVAIRPEVEALVTAVLVGNGETVRKGQALVRLDGQRLEEQLSQARSSLQVAQAAEAEARAQAAAVEAAVTRSRRLAQEELISDLELETLEAQLNAAAAAADQEAARVAQARSTVEERRSALGRTVVRAPVDGRVGRRNAEVGMLVNPGSLLFLMGDLTKLRVEIPLTESMLGYLAEGQRVQIQSTDGPMLEAELSRISPFLDEASFSTIGEIDLDLDAQSSSGDEPASLPLRPGTFVAVDVLYGESEQVTLVPASAAWEDPRTGILGIYVLAGGADGPSGLEVPSSIPRAGEGVAGLPPLGETPYGVELRPVEVRAEGRGVLGVSGVETGEWVVVQGQQLLSGAAAEELTARVRPSSWERVESLQSLQREDLLRRFLDKQRRYAAERGARPPTNEEYLAAPVEAGVAASEEPTEEGR